MIYLPVLLVEMISCQKNDTSDIVPQMKRLLKHTRFSVSSPSRMKGAYAIDEMKKRCGVFVLTKVYLEKGVVWQQNYM